MESCREAGDFACGGVAMDRALYGGPIQRRGRELERFLGGGTVAGGNRFARLFDRAVNAGLDQAVTDLALHALAMALLSGRMIRNMRHNLYHLTAAERAVNEYVAATPESERQTALAGVRKAVEDHKDDCSGIDLSFADTVNDYIERLMKSFE